MSTRSFAPRLALGGRIHAYARVSTEPSRDGMHLDEQIRIIAIALRVRHCYADRRLEGGGF